MDEPSAMYHNPAGLRGVSGLEVTLHVSPILGQVTSTPGDSTDARDPDTNLYPERTSELIVAPAFLLGVGYRLADFLVLGFGAYPVASASGEYQTVGTDYLTNQARARVNKTKLTFIEASPGLSVELPRGITLGAGYRITLAELSRVQGWADDPDYFDFAVSGVDAKGFRAGLQWQLGEHASVGAVYRHRVEPELSGDRGRAVGFSVERLKTRFVLPSKLGVGGRGDFGDLGAALDVEYGFYSQNERTQLQGCRSDEAPQPSSPSCFLGGRPRKLEVVDNVFDWQNAFTVRVGGEYRVASTWPLRVGYVFDGKVASEHYPSAFGTPPAPSHSFTAGAGYRAERWQVSLALAYRTASASISQADTGDLETPDPYPCATCSKAGKDYSLWLLGSYVDFSYDFDVAPLF